MMVLIEKQSNAGKEEEKKQRKNWREGFDENEIL